MNEKIKLRNVVRNDNGIVEEIAIFDPNTDQLIKMAPVVSKNEEAKVCLQTKSGKTIEGTINLCKHRRVSDWFENVKTIRLYNAVHQGHPNKVIFMDKESVDFCWESNK